MDVSVSFRPPASSGPSAESAAGQRRAHTGAVVSIDEALTAAICRRLADVLHALSGAGVQDITVKLGSAPADAAVLELLREVNASCSGNLRVLCSRNETQRSLALVGLGGERVRRVIAP